ncbi:MAG: AbrB/MazE/SpoVT family DNA-binding domain-containing protein [Oscillospiraceae bacterium]|jgi:antitoxin MazE|nr:AbrB/MazE/SpoVT family DNA-binding domain-containing protein [Oscillospiraceae bacterium]
MNTTITKWGNSQGIRLPKYILEAANISGSDVEVTPQDDCIIIRQAKMQKGRKRIEELFADYDGGYLPQPEIDFGEPVGKEVW